MLVITRKAQESVRIGDAVVTIGEIAASYVRLVINAPRETPIVRAELLRNVVPAQPLPFILRDAIGAEPLPYRGTIGPR